jgi:hypothetical protein
MWQRLAHYGFVVQRNKTSSFQNTQIITQRSKTKFLIQGKKEKNSTQKNSLSFLLNHINIRI